MTKRRVYTERHGQTWQNAQNRLPGGGIFFGGGPDGVPGSPNATLTTLGERQGTASGIAARAAGLAIQHVVSSELERARQTKNLSVVAYDGTVTDHGTRAGFNEISHGALEREGLTIAKSKHIASISLGALEGALASNNHSPEHISAYAAWILPLGYGDGQTHLEVGHTFCEAIREQEQDGLLVVSHHGSARDGRALGGALTHDGHLEIAHELAALAPVYEEARSTVTQLHENGEWSEGALIETFSPIAEAAGPLIIRLGRLHVPPMDEVINPKCKSPNGAIVCLTIADDGRLEREARITPQFDPLVTPTTDNVFTLMEPYNQACPSWV